MGTYLEDHHYKPGWAVWAFQVGKYRIYRQKNYHALKFYWKERDKRSFTVEVRTRQGWKFVTKNTPSENCICGRPYLGSNGEEFKFQAPPLEYTIESLAELMRSPVLCMVCYYKGELKEGRWAPKQVKKELGLET